MNLTLSSRKKRIAAFLIDHFILTSLIVSVFFLILGPNFMNHTKENLMPEKNFFLVFPGLLLYLGKDSFHGISLGKWIMGIAVRNENNREEIPSFGRLLLRNLLLVIWPVEFIVLAVNGNKKRLGDQIAKTVVVENPNVSAKLPRIAVLVLVGVSLFTFILLFANTAIKNSDSYKVSIREIEKNKEVLIETGGIKGYGMLPSGNVNTTNGYGQAKLEIKVEGIKKDITVSTYLEKEPETQWKLVKMEK